MNAPASWRRAKPPNNELRLTKPCEIGASQLDSGVGRIYGEGDVATLEEVRPGQLLTWRGHVGAPWLFEGHRRFEIHSAGERRVSVTQVEDIHGLLAPPFAVFMGGPVERSHHALNQALRTRAESPH